VQVVRWLGVGCFFVPALEGMEEDEAPPYVAMFIGNKQKPLSATLEPSKLTSRYKTRQLQIQFEGRGSRRTSLVNINDVAKDMHVPSSYLCAYIGLSLNVKFNFSAERDPKRQAFIACQPPLSKLSDIVQKFITEMILCPNCGLPELIFEVESKAPGAKPDKGGGSIKVHCQACGKTSKKDIGNKRLEKFILANPPSQEYKDAFTLNKEKQNPLLDLAGPNSSSDEEDGEEDEDVVWLSDTSEAAVLQRKRDCKSSFFAPGGLGSSGEGF